MKFSRTPDKHVISFLFITVLPEKENSAPSKRIKWTNDEKKIACDYFKNHIKGKITPKKHECQQLLESQSTIFKNKDWVRIKTFIYNTFRQRK